MKQINTAGDTAKLTKNVAYHEVTEKISTHIHNRRGWVMPRKRHHKRSVNTDEKLQDGRRKSIYQAQTGKYYADEWTGWFEKRHNKSPQRQITHPRERRLQMRRQPTQPIQLSQMVYQRLIWTHTQQPVNSHSLTESSEDTVLKADDDYTISLQRLSTAYANNGGKAGVQAPYIRNRRPCIRQWCSR